jgi:hypothetical protein
VFEAILALLSVAGAWVAWRRNPNYSVRATLRFLVAAAIAAGAAIGLIVAATQFADGKSMPIAMGIMLVAVVVVTLTMIFVIQRVSTPASARLHVDLPPSAVLVNVHRRKAYLWMKVLGAILGVCALGALLPYPALYIFGVIGGMALLLGLVMLPVLYVNARNFDRSLSVLIASPWLHWTYPPQQWQQWADVQRERGNAVPPTFLVQRDWPKLAWPFGAIAVGVYAFSPGSILYKTLYIVGVCAAISALVALSVRSQKRGGERQRAVLLRAVPEVYFGQDGMYFGGVFSTWLGMNTYLKEASIDAREPRSLAFRFETSMPNPYGAAQVLQVDRNVPIPAGAEADIARLQSELSARCPAAQIHLV